MFKLMTLNLNYHVNKHGPWERRLHIVREAIEAHRPDVVALQAVRGDAATNQAAQLSECLPDYRYAVFQPAQHLPDGQANGSAWLSRLPLEAQEHLSLSLRPGLDDGNPRVLLHARLDLPDGPLHLFNAHFSWVGEQAEDNVREAMSYVATFTGRAALAGDMNNTPDSAPLERIRRAGWFDAWGMLRPGEPGYTFESNAPTLRIDYVWVNALLRPLLRAVHLVAERTDESGARASDHFALLAEFAAGGA